MGYRQRRIEHGLRNIVFFLLKMKDGRGGNREMVSTPEMSNRERNIKTKYNENYEYLPLYSHGSSLTYLCNNVAGSGLGGVVGCGVGEIGCGVGGEDGCGDGGDVGCGVGSFVGDGVGSSVGGFDVGGFVGFSVHWPDESMGCGVG